MVIAWLSGKAVLINVVALRRARLILRWVTVYERVNQSPRLTQPSTLCGPVKWVSAFGLSNDKKCWRWVHMVAACRRTHSRSRLARSEGWWSLGAAFIEMNWVNCCNVLAVYTHCSDVIIVIMMVNCNKDDYGKSSLNDSG